MAKWLSVLAVALFAILALASNPAQAQAILRERVTASGPAVTLGDFFQNAGEVGGRAVAPAPRPGQVTAFPARFVEAAAAAAGLAWRAPADLQEILVIGQRASARATSAAPPAIRRGDTITLVYIAPGLQLTARGRALNDAAIGEGVRVVNLQSEVTVEAVATGPGAASANAVN
ncbi:MAG: flagellar basal body P-ring formation protein FlgA [Alphaproteobacteria bacterium]|nr:flagellar basal body P-ring formation protein FlgA [Alphaproteobacteria bacterium]